MQTETNVTCEVFYSTNFAKKLNPDTSKRLKRVFSILQSSKCRRLLDIGCGDGSFSSTLKSYCPEIYGVDIAADAAKTATARGIKTSQVNIDVEELPFQNSFFDAIYCGDVIEHMYDPDHLLDEINRVLAPGGVCVITTPNLASWLNRLVLLFGYQPYNTEVSLKRNVGKFRAKAEEVSGHIRVFPYKSLKELLEFHEFQIEKAVGISMTKNLPSIVKPIDLLLSKKASLGPYLVVVIRKKYPKISDEAARMAKKVEKSK
jgi:2-polyprenyl-3-methyl-5-hydroxy-6-metoxy-1,4-benzoquinol methylase